MRHLIAFSDIAGRDPDGLIPARFADECRLALSQAQSLLAARGLSLHDIDHIAYAVRDTDALGQCQAMIAEALGAGRPAVTLRLVNEFPIAGQRIAFGVSAHI